jgi:hypothetical protein
MRYLALCSALLLAACASPGSSGVQVIVGAKLIAAPGSTPVEYSVVVIEDGKFKAVGAQSSTPVPKGSEITRGLGMTIAPPPGGAPIESGHAANLVLKETEQGPVVRIMRDGHWLP